MVKSEFFECTSKSFLLRRLWRRNIVLLLKIRSNFSIVPAFDNILLSLHLLVTSWDVDVEAGGASGDEAFLESLEAEASRICLPSEKLLKVSFFNLKSS